MFRTTIAGFVVLGSHLVMLECAQMSNAGMHTKSSAESPLPKRALVRLGTLRYYSPVGEIEAGRIAISSDSRLIAVTSANEVRVFDAKQGTVVATFGSHGKAECATFTSDGTQIVYGCGDGQLRIAKVSARHRARAFQYDLTHDFFPTSVRIFPDRRTVISINHGERWVRLWDASKRRELCRVDLGCFAGPFDLSRDGTRLATANSAGFALWKIKDNRNFHKIRSEGPEANTVAFFTNGKHFAVAQEDGRIAIRNAATGRRESLLRGHRGPVRELAVAPDGRTLFSTGDDNTLRAWDAIGAKQLSATKVLPHGVNAIAVFPDGKRLAWTDSFGCAHISKLPVNVHNGDLAIDRSWVNAADFSHDGQVVATAEARGAVCFWDAMNGKLLKTIPGRQSAIYCISRIPGKGAFVSGGEDGVLRIHSIGGATKDREYRLDRGRILSISVPSKGTTVAIANERGTISVVKLSSGKITATLQKKGWRAESVAISPNGRFVAGGGGDVIVWDVKTRKEVCTITPKQFDSSVNCLAFSPDSRVLAFAGGEKNGQLEVWDVMSHKALFRKARKSNGGFQAVRFSPDGKLLAFADGRGMVYVATMPDGRMYLKLSGHQDSVRPNALSFSPDGRRLVSSGLDTTAIVWDVTPHN